MQRHIKEVEVLDAMCGTGKSYNLFKFISNNASERFLYITPMLSEVETRPAEELAKFGETGICFEVPSGDGYQNKGEHLQALLVQGANVICTHALFQLINKIGQQFIASHKYTIIIDEELGMIEPLGEEVLKRDDRIGLLREGFISTEEDGKVIWKTENWGSGNSAFSTARKMAENGSLYSTRDGTFFNVQVPIDVISQAQRVVVATYMFKGSIFEAFLKVKGIGYREFYFEGLELRKERDLKAALRDRVEMFDCEKSTDKLLSGFGVPINDIKAKRKNGIFSASWYRGVNGKAINEVAKHIRNVARQMGVNHSDLIYTLPSNIAGKNGERWIRSGAKIIKVKGYSPEMCFLHKGSRATNIYSDKTAAIHLYNRYPNPALTSYLKEQGASVDSDSFALAELIQWFFRTAIRVPNGPKVKLHISSPRMNDLFKRWLYDDSVI